jgi:hypothetical protein
MLAALPQVQTSTLQHVQAQQQALPQQLLLVVQLPPVLLPLQQQQQAQQVLLNAAYRVKQSTHVRQLPTHLCSCSCRCGMPLAGSCKFTLTRSSVCY